MDDKTLEYIRAKRREYKNRYRQTAAGRAERRRHRERRVVAADALLVEFRANGCLLCPEREPACMCAHHRDPAEKDFSISQGRRAYAEPRLRAELAKCVCLCHNCHAKLHAGIISLPQP